MPVPVETRNGLTQCEQTQGGGVGQGPAVHDAAHLLADRGRSAEIRLTQAELGDRVTLRLEDSGAFADAHRIEGLSGCGPGGDLHDDSLTRGQNKASVPLPVAGGQRSREGTADVSRTGGEGLYSDAVVPPAGLEPARP